MPHKPSTFHLETVQVNKLLKTDGRVVVYGMIANPKINFPMREVLKHHHPIDLKDATAFMAEHWIVPVVSHVSQGLEAAGDGFSLLQRGEQFGKIILTPSSCIGSVR